MFARADGRPWTYQTRTTRFSAALKAAVEAKGVDGETAGHTFYQLKHAAVTVLLGQGVKLAIVSRITGVSADTLMRSYAGFMVDEQAAELRRVCEGKSVDASRARGEVDFLPSFFPSME